MTDERVIEEARSLLNDEKRLGLLNVHPRSPVTRIIEGLLGMVERLSAEREEMEAPMKRYVAIGQAIEALCAEPNFHILEAGNAAMEVRYARGKPLRGLSRKLGDGRGLLGAAKKARSNDE